MSWMARDGAGGSVVRSGTGLVRSMGGSAMPALGTTMSIVELGEKAMAVLKAVIRESQEATSVRMKVALLSGKRSVREGENE